MRIKEVTGGLDHPVPQDEVLLHLRAPQVEVAVLQADCLIHVDIILNVERRGLGGVEDSQLLGPDLELACRHVRVDRLRRPAHEHAPHGQHVLATHLFRLLENLAGLLGVEDHLHEARPVAHVDENQGAMVAPPLDPAINGHDLADLRFANVAAEMSSLHAMNRFGHVGSPPSCIALTRSARGTLSCVPASMCFSPATPFFTPSSPRITT